MNLLKKTTIGLALASTAALAAAPAQARDYYGHRNDNAAPAIIAGVLGIAAIAAIASSHNNDRYRDGYYYRDGRRYRHADRNWDRRDYERRGYYGQSYGDYGQSYGGYGNSYGDYNGYRDYRRGY
jgi:hypothetical protein